MEDRESEPGDEEEGFPSGADSAEATEGPAGSPRPASEKGGTTALTGTGEAGEGEPQGQEGPGAEVDTAVAGSGAGGGGEAGEESPRVSSVANLRAQLAGWDLEDEEHEQEEKTQGGAEAKEGEEEEGDVKEGEGGQQQEDEEGEEGEGEQQAQGDTDALGPEEVVFGEEAEVPAPARSSQEEAITALQRALEEEEVPDYEAQFASRVPGEEITVGVVDEEAVRKQEAALERARAEEARRLAMEHANREAQLAVREHEARRRVATEAAHARAKVWRREDQASERERQRQQEVHRVFQHAEERLRHVVSRQKAVVQTSYGDMERVDAATARRFRVEWRGLPQPVQVNVEMMRAVKDKLPRGRYVLLVQLYDRLGGRPMRWSRLTGKGAGASKPSATRPVRHRGRFHDTELRFGQSVFSLCPAKWLTRPTNCFVFELFLLGGRRHPVDRVVGWGVLPMANIDLNVVEGAFRVPMLRGAVDPEVDKYETYERTYARDVDRWLCNLYVEIQHLPREMLARDGSIRREYDVELAYTQELLALEEGDREGEADEDEDIERGGGGGSGDEEEKGDENDEDDENEMLLGQQLPTLDEMREEARRKRNRPALRWKAAGSFAQLTPPAGRKSRGGGGDGGSGTSGPVDPLIGQLSLAQLRGAVGGGDQGSGAAEEKQGSDAPPSSAGSMIRRLASESEGERVGVGGAVQTAHGIDAGKTGLRGALAHSDTGAGAGVQLEKAQALSKYEYAVRRQHAIGEDRMSESVRRLEYLRHEIMVDLGLTQWTTLEFWLVVFTLLVALWLRLYTHYMGQWLYLTALRVPVYQFTPYLHTVLLKYVSTSIPVAVEIMVVVMGPLFNLAVMALLIGLSWVCRHLLGRFPDTGSRFVSAFSMGTVLDPLLVLLVDVVSENFNCTSRGVCATDFASEDCLCAEGDAFKLYERFEREEGSGVVGIFLTLFIYASLSTLAAFAFYYYMLHVHMNGRMVDVYRRLQSPDDTFFVPHDFECSVAEVRWVCAKAARWRGPRGSQRKVSVCNYAITSPLDPGYRELTTHLAVFTLDTDGTRRLYRHFIRMPVGTILELFGDMAAGFGARYDVLEQLLSSSDEAGGTRGVETFLTGAAPHSSRGGRASGPPSAVSRAGAGAGARSVGGDSDRQPLLHR